MLFFVNDYGYGAHPKVLEHLTETNMQPLTGYGNDEITASAAEKIKAVCACPEGQVYFLTGGTQTNMVVIDALLRPYEGVVASSCGHVNTHEAGAIESTGHKVLTVPHRNGKLDADDLREYIETFYADESHNHMVFPGMVYISHPSEYGTLYTKNELERISAVCKAFDLPLFLDGARLGYGLTADTDVTLPDIARADRCVLHRRHQVRRAVRRGGRVHARQYAAPVRDHGQAPRRDGRKGPPERGCSSTPCSPTACMRRSAHRRCSLAHQTARRSRGKGIPLCDRLPHQSAVYHRRKQQAARTAAARSHTAL